MESSTWIPVELDSRDEWMENSFQNLVEGDWQGGAMQMWLLTWNPSMDSLGEGREYLTWIVPSLTWNPGEGYLGEVMEY